MRSAVLFLPSIITLLMNICSGLLWYLPSGGDVAPGGSCLVVAMASLLPRAVLAAAALAVGDAGGVQRAADDVVAHARQVLDAAAADQHHGVLLQAVAFAGDVGRDFHLLVRRTRAILRSAEFGFLGVIVCTWTQTPRFCGEPLVHFVLLCSAL